MVAMIKDNPFLLSKRDSTYIHSGEFSRKKLKQWSDRLLTGDVEHTAYELLNKLDNLNAEGIFPVRRFDLLELLQPTVDYILESLKRRCTHCAVPLDFHRKMIADLRLSILIQVVKGYKTVVSQLHDAKFTAPMFHKDVRRDALKKAVVYLGEVLLHSYITYQSCISYAWKELHGIYHYSEINGLNEKKELGTKQSYSDLTSIEDIYKQILLLSLANPYSLSSGEVERVNLDLEALVAFVDLKPLDKEISAESYYLIDACKDTMPCASYLQKEESVKLGWCLVTDGLNKKLRNTIATLEAAQNSLRPTDAATLRLMNKLRDAWLNQIRSREIRDPSADNVDLVCGFDSIYHIRGGEDIGDANSWQRRLNMRLSGYGRESVCSPILDNDEVLIEVDPGTLESYQVHKGATYPKLKKDQITIERKECIAINRSENGYCLNWADNGEMGAHVGELVGISHKDNVEQEANTNFGVIRWLHADCHGHMGVGVELFNGLLEPVMLHHKYEDNKWTETIRGFLQYAKSGEVVSLIAPPFYVAKDDQIRIVINSKDIPVGVTNIIESTDSFVRFKFDHISSAVYG